jgi:glycosyltransferase involved in cell wall biosynthesis
MSIFIATLSRATGQEGVQTHFNEFRRFLERKGTNVRFVNPFDNTRALVWPTFAMGRVINPFSGALGVWWYRYFHYVLLRRAVARHLRSGRPCIVYAQCPLSALAAMQARRSPEQKIVLAIHYNSSQADEWILRGKLRADSTIAARIRAVEASLPSRVDGLVVFSEFMRRAVIDAAPAASNVPLIVTSQFIGGCEEPAENATQGDLISIGPPEPRKNHQYLLRVLAAAKRRGQRYTLTIVGRGPLRRRLMRLARELDVGDQVTFAGFQPHAARWLPAHRAFVHSSLVESFGVSLVEAMACGLPVFAAPVGAIPEVFEDGVEGRYWPLDNPDAAAEILIDVLESPASYARMSTDARLRFERHFQTEQLAPRLAEFLAALARGQQPGGCVSVAGDH